MRKTVQLELTQQEARAVHLALYRRLNDLAMVEDHNPDPGRREQARRDAAPVIAVADRLKAAMETTT